MDPLVTVSRAFGQLVESLGPSIVQVQSARCSGATGVVWAKDRILTSARAFDPDELLEVRFNGKKVGAERIGVHPPSDLLLLKVDADLPVVRVASEEARLGELVLSLTRSHDKLRARVGSICATGGEWRLPGGASVVHYLETDIEPAAGAGGALFSVDGGFVGVNKAGLARGALVTLPAASLGALVEALASHGRVRRAHIGVLVQPARLPRAVADVAGRRSGLLVAALLDDSPAEAAGLVLGDVLLELGGRPLANPEDLQAVLGDDAIGRELPVRLLRGGEQRTLTLRPLERT